MTLRRTLLALIFTAGLSMAADPALLQLVMKDARMVAGIDFDRAKNSPFGQKILGEMKEEDQGFQKLVTSTGFDPRRDLREVVLAATGAPKDEAAIVLVRGTFDQGKIGQFLRSEGGEMTPYKGVELWKSPKAKNGNEVAAFLNPTLAIFGKEFAVKEAVDRSQTRTGGMDAATAAKVGEWSSKNDAWFVSTAALAEMGIGKSGNNAILPGGLSLDAIRQASAGVKFGDIVELTGELTARSDQDAVALGDVFRFLASMVRLNADKPGMQDALKVAETLQVSTSGAVTRFSLSVSEAHLEKMLESKKARRQTASAVR